MFRVGRQPISDTGLEQAVAAPKVAAKSSIKCQFSGPFKPLPPDTTTSASAMLTCPVAASTAVTLSCWSPMPPRWEQHLPF